MKYWVSYSAFQMFEHVSDITLSFILPFYIELKIMSIMWLVLGARIVFDSIINRELTKREKSIDRYLGKLNKLRDELIAVIWFEISRFSVQLISSMMTGGFAILASAPETLLTAKQSSQNRSAAIMNSNDNCATNTEDSELDSHMDVDTDSEHEGGSEVELIPRRTKRLTTAKSSLASQKSSHMATSATNLATATSHVTFARARLIRHMDKDFIGID